MITAADIIALAERIRRPTVNTIRGLLDSPLDLINQRLAQAAEQVSTDFPTTRSVFPEINRENQQRYLEQAVGLLPMVGMVSAEGLNKAARAKRIVGTTGKYVGAPPGVDNSAKYNAQINAYVDRIDEALKNGVERGYFYKSGTVANRAVTDSPAALDRLALMEGVTSSEAPVHTNTGWAIKGIEQRAMGAPINTGKYPNAWREKVSNILAGDASHIGEKTHRYSSGLAGDVKGLAPNDRWEIRSFGYKTDSAGPAQHSYMDEVRQKAVERWNAKHPDQQPLSILEGQELNWATQRARDMGIPHQQSAADTIQDALRAHTIQHSWESRGGEKAGHLRDMPVEQLPEYHAQISDVLLDPSGKDKLVRAMGGELQFPAVHGPGVYEGFVAPGTQSRSIGYLTQAGGLDPTTEARVKATEAVRALGLGQDAYAYHGLLTPKGISAPKTDTIDVAIGRTIGEQDAKNLTDLLGSTFGGGAGVVPTEGGFRVLRFDENKNFAKQFQKNIEQQLPGLLGSPAQIRHGMRAGGYGELDWAGHNATRDALEALNSASAPKLKEYADSAQTRELMGRLAGVYEQKAAEGLTPNPRLALTLRTWEKEGLAGLDRLVKAGLAAGFGAAGLLPFYGEQWQQPSSQ